MRIKQIHRLFAVFLGLFVLAHLINHALIFLGPEAHLKGQAVLRHVYQNPLVEFVLVLAFGAQVVFGLKLALKRGWPKRVWMRVQTISGLVFAGFILQHLSAALFVRWFVMDTTVYWAASVLSTPVSAAYFAPYYFAGVTSLFVHVASHLALRKTSAVLVWGLIVLGAVFAFSLIWHLMALPALETVPMEA